MLLRLLTRAHRPSLALKPSFVSAFSTTQSVAGEQSKDEFYLRHQLESKHDSGQKWKVYRVASVGLLGGLVGCFVCPGNAVIDYATVALLVHHNYAGLNSVITDYFPLFLPDWFTSLTIKLWLAISIVALALLFSFNYNNAGFSKTLISFLKL